MSEPRLIHTILEIILCAALSGIFIAIIEVSLHCLTSDRQPPGFRIAPTSAAGWIGYYLRTLILICILATSFGGQPYIHPVVPATALYSAPLLLGSSAVFWRTERALCIVSIVGGLFALLVSPRLATVKETC